MLRTFKRVGELPEGVVLVSGVPRCQETTAAESVEIHTHRAAKEEAEAVAAEAMAAEDR